MEVRLHIGAQRTGTTRLQEELKRRSDWLRGRGLAVHWPKHVRPRNNFGFHAKAGLPAPVSHLVRSRSLRQVARLRAEAEAANLTRMVVSEENWAGVVDGMISTGKLYPSIARRIGLLAPVFEGDRVTLLFSVRNYADFFSSIYSLRTRKRPMPPFERYKAHYLRLPRRWPAVLSDLARAFPGAEVIVWPFESMRGHGRAALQKILGLDDIVAVNEDLAPVLPSPSAAAIARLNEMRTGPDLHRSARRAVIAELQDGPRFDPWSAEERAALTVSYKADLAQVSAAPPANLSLIDLADLKAGTSSEVAYG